MLGALVNLPDFLTATLEGVGEGDAASPGDPSLPSCAGGWSGGLGTTLDSSDCTSGLWTRARLFRLITEPVSVTNW